MSFSTKVEIDTMLLEISPNPFNFFKTSKDGISLKKNKERNPERNSNIHEKSGPCALNSRGATILEKKAIALSTTALAHPIELHKVKIKAVLATVSWRSILKAKMTFDTISRT
jgi:hypothetical protein